MKPTPDFFNWTTTDLTEGHIHKKDDGSIVIRFPKKWEIAHSMNVQDRHSDGPRNLKSYNVTEWEEVPLK